MDDDRLRGIAKELLDIMQEHGALAERTTDPLFLQLIELLKRYFVLWYAQGLMETAAPEDSDLELASHATVGDIEAEIIELAGRRGWEAFAAWADSQGLGWEEPFYLRDHSLWEQVIA